MTKEKQQLNSTKCFLSFILTCVNVHSIQIWSGLEVELSGPCFILLGWGFPSWCRCSGYGVVPHLPPMMNLCCPFVPVSKVSGAFGKRMIFCCNPLGRVSLKK